MSETMTGEPNPHNVSQTPPKKMKRADRRKKVGVLLLAEKSYAEIAEELNVSKATVSRDVTWLLDQWRKEAVDEVREAVTLELRRIEAIQATLWPKVREGDLPTIDRWEKLHQRRAKLLRLDQPMDVVLNINLKDLDDDQIRRLNAGEDVYSVLRGPDS